MTFDDIKEMHIGSKKVKEAWLNGRQVYPSEKRIMDSLVCWYDPGKQQCTNESMAANPVLADLSGNGHDITCYNFAWTEESGISTTNYPNALVSDGVDDYAMVEGLPILTDYTVIAKRSYQGFEQNLRDNNIALAGKSTASENGAFMLERLLRTGNYSEYNFGRYNDITLHNNIITYATKFSYNGVQKLNAGELPDTDTLFLFTKARYNSVVQAALYSFLLFDRTLTTAEIEWVKKNMIESNDDAAEWYGVEFYTTSPNPDCIRIGNPNLHRTLPVHSLMRGCLLNDDGSVNKYLDASTWESETRDGSQGQVMVEVPDHYMRFETDGNIRRVKLSTVPIAGYRHIKKYYVSAYEATVQRSTTMLCSVVNMDADYRGGNNNAELDGTSATFLGKPATSISRTNFRNYARKRKEGSSEWNCMTYDIQKDLFWLFVIEYATLNTQKAFNEALTADGYHQGGLGPGVTEIDYTKWGDFNGRYPFIPCGHSDSLGNKTGVVDYTMPTEYDAASVKVCKVPRYRGIENPFGHIWQWTEGINVRISPNTEDGGDGLSKVFVCSDPSQFSDTGYEGYQYVGDEARTDAYVKEVIFGEGGEIMPLVVGGSSTTFFPDFHYTNIPKAETLRGVLFGGAAYYGANAGFVFAYSYCAPSFTSAHFGSRLCFIPA